MSTDTDTADIQGDDAAEALFLERLEAHDAPQEAAEGVSPAEGTEAPAEGEEAPSEAAEGTDDPERPLASDDHLVLVKVGDEERRVPVAELKALFGREAAIAARDAETATALKRVNEEGERAVSVMGQLIREAETEWAKYAQVDLVLAAQRMPEEAYKQLRADGQEAYRRLAFLKESGNGFVAQVRANRQAMIAEAVSKCDASLAADADPLVKGWDAKARTDLIDYAVAQGLPRDAAMGLTEPAAIKLLRKAALYDKGLTAAAKAIKPVATSATRTTLKPGAKGTTAVTPAQTKLDEAMSRARKSGGQAEDIEAAFLARFG